LLYALWLFAPTLQSAIGYRMWTRRLYRDYPVFFAYILNQLVIFFVLVYCLSVGAFATYTVKPTSVRALSSAVTA